MACLSDSGLDSLSKHFEQGRIHFGSMLTPEECQAVLYLMRCGDTAVARLGSDFLVHRTPVGGGPGAVAVNGDGILVLQPGQTLSYFMPLSSAFSVCGPAAVPLAPYRQAYLDAGDNRSMIAINRHASGKPLQIHRHILVLPSGEFLNFEAGGYDVLLTSDEPRPEAADHLPHLLRLLPKVERFSKVEPYTDEELKGFLAVKGVGMSCYV